MDKNCNNGISRRSALKRMGLLIAGAACINMPTLTSCNMDTKKRIILYFTGTGNCLYVARELADEHTELLSIPQLVKQGRYTFEADEIGIVYPVYGHMPPNMVREFIKKAQLKAGYKFAVLTYGNRKCSSVTGSCQRRCAARSVRMRSKLSGMCLSILICSFMSKFGSQLSTIIIVVM